MTTSIVEPVRKERSYARSRTALSAIFVAHAVIIAAWAPRIPIVQARAGLTDAQLGLVLAAGPASSLFTMFVAGRLIDRMGGRRLLRWFLPAFCLSAVLPCLSTSESALAAAIAVWDGLGAVVGVAMNVLATEIENESGRPFMARLHGLWSLGAFAGAGISTLLASTRLVIGAQAAVVGGLVLVVGLRPLTWLPDLHARSAPSGRSRLRVGPVLVGLGVMAFCAQLCEGGTETWSSNFLAGPVGVRVAFAGIGYTCYALSMCCARFFVDRAVTRFGSVATLRTLSALAVLGWTAALAAPTPVVAIAAFVMIGIGFSAALPLVLRAGAHLPGVPAGSALSLLSGAGGVGLVCGPPIIGALASVANLRAGLAVVPLLGLLIVVLAPLVSESPRRRQRNGP